MRVIAPTPDGHGSVTPMRVLVCMLRPVAACKRHGDVGLRGTRSGAEGTARNHPGAPCREVPQASEVSKSRGRTASGSNRSQGSPPIRGGLGAQRSATEVTLARRKKGTIMRRRRLRFVLSITSLTLVTALVGCSGSTPDNGAVDEPADGGTSEDAPPTETYNLRFNHVLSETEPYHAGFLDWADAVEERTNGGLTIDVYPSAQLGVEEDIIEQMKNGVNVGQNTDSARLGQYVPEIAVMNGPYFVDTLDEVEALRESPTIQALGAEPVAMNFGEVYSGIQQGAVDGAELVYANIPASNLFEVLSYANETGHILLINFEVVSAEWFNSLPEEYQEILMEEADRAGLETSQTMEDMIPEIKEQLIAEGMTINEDVDVEAFREAGE